MKVLLVLSGKRLGGTQQVCVDYARLLSARKHDVFVCLHPKSDTRECVRKQGLDRIKMVLSRVVAGRRAQYNPLKWAKALALVIGNKIDIVVMLNRYAFPLFSRVTRGRCPVVAYHENYLFDWSLTADAAICLTQGMVDRLRQVQISRGREFTDRPICCVPNPLSIPIARSRPVTRDPVDRPVKIGALGRMIRTKGFSVLLRAVSLLKGQGVPFRLVLGGDGPELPTLQHLSKELGLMSCVDFPGWITDRESFFDQIDMFCLSSFRETFGLVVTEAMARGCPVIVSNAEGPSSIIDNGVTGLVVEKGAVDALASALHRLIKDPPLAAKLAANAQISVEQNFGDAVVGDRLEAALTTVIRDYRKARN